MGTQKSGRFFTVLNISFIPPKKVIKLACAAVLFDRDNSTFMHSFKLITDLISSGERTSEFFTRNWDIIPAINLILRGVPLIIIRTSEGKTLLSHFKQRSAPHS